MVLYMDRMCQRRLHAVLWSHIGILMHRLAQNLVVQQDFYSLLCVPLERSANPVFDGVGLAGSKSRVNASLLALAALSLLLSSTFFPFLFFLSIGWYCGAGVLGLIGCIPLSLSLALQTVF